MMYHGNLRRIEGGGRGFYDRQAPPPPSTKLWWFLGQVVLYMIMFAVAAGVSQLIVHLGL